jgi:hypothetical protein
MRKASVGPSHLALAISSRPPYNLLSSTPTLSGAQSPSGGAFHQAFRLGSQDLEDSKAA